MNTPDGFLAFRQDTESNVSPHAAFTKYHADARAPWIAPPGLRESDLGEERICKLVIALAQQSLCLVWLVLRCNDACSR